MRSAINITFPLQGDDFCGMPGTPEDCTDLVDAWMPAAMNVLAGLLASEAEVICQEEIGVC
jgi:hypothetical protein